MMRSLTLFGPVIAAVVAAASLAGCGRGEPPAPVVLKGGGYYGRERPAPPPRASSTAARRETPAAEPGTLASPRRAVVVERGDTLYSIARRHGVPLRALIEVNGLEPPYLLRVGQRLRLPAPRVHVVRPGETVYGISRAYGVDMSALMRLNGIRPPYTITVGQRLRLPSPIAAAAAPAGSRPAVAGGGARTPSEATPPPKRLAAIPRPPPRSGRRFLWPVRGRIVSSFGPKSSGLHNDGINIVAPRGTHVRAAENGVVAYAGNELRGFGNLVLLKHAGGWMTAYAHNDVVLVRRGDRVKRGQPIARVGSTGNVVEPQLHFEIRRGARAVDPRRLLAAAEGIGPTSRVAGRGAPPSPG